MTVTSVSGHLQPPPASTTRTGPLAGVRVLDLTGIVLGPFATQLLGDYGADVIKVEPPEGDLTRANGVSRGRAGLGGMSSIFLAVNRNKRSLAIDLKHPEGAAALKRLLPTFDVLVHNMRSAAIERLGFGYAACTAIAPNLVYCVGTGFGESGPDAGKPAFDDVIQASCGLVGLIREETGEANYIPSLIADKTAGLALANAVLAALYERSKSGRGQYVEVPMLETLVAFTLIEHLGGLTFEPAEGPAGYQRLLAGGRKPVPTRDGHVALLPYTDMQWRKFFAHVGRQDLVDEFGYDVRVRNARVKELYAEMAAIAKTMTTAELLALCEELDIPGTPIYAINELPEHPHLKAVGLFKREQHPSVGSIVTVRPTTLFSRTPAALSLHTPELGEHSVSVLLEAGMTKGEVVALCEAGIVRQASEQPKTPPPESGLTLSDEIISAILV